VEGRTPKNSSRECVACGHTEQGNRHRARFSCLACGHEAHADVNAAQVLTTRGQVAEVLDGKRLPAAGCDPCRTIGDARSQTDETYGPGRLLTRQPRNLATWSAADPLGITIALGQALHDPYPERTPDRPGLTVMAPVSGPRPDQ